MRIQQALLQSRIRQPLWKMLHDVDDEANSLFGKGRNQVIVSGLFPVNPVKAEMALGQHEPADRLVHPKSRQSEAVEAGRPGLGEVNQVLILQDSVKRGVTTVRISEQYDLQDQTDYISAGKFGRFTIHASADFPSTRSRIGGLYICTFMYM
jgi:hypothetical protein